MKDILDLIDTSKVTHTYLRKSDLFGLMGTVVAGSSVSIGQDWRKENITSLEVVTEEVSASDLEGELTYWIEKFDVNGALWPMYVNLANLETSSQGIGSEIRDLADLKNEYRFHINSLVQEKNLLIDEINDLKKDLIDFKEEVTQDKEFLISLESEIRDLESSAKTVREKETDPFKIAKGILNMDEEKYLQIRDDL